MTDQTRYAVKVRTPAEAEPDWAPLLAARIAPLLDATAVEVVTALVNHASIAPDSSFEDAERLVAHLRTLGVTGVLVERPPTSGNRAEISDSSTLRGLLPIPADDASKGRNTQPFMLAGEPRAGPEPPPPATRPGRSGPPRMAPGSQPDRAPGLEPSLHGFGESSHAHGATRPFSQPQVPSTAASPLTASHWGAVTPARIQERGTKPGIPSPSRTPRYQVDGNGRAQTDSYQLDGQPLSHTYHRQTQRLPDPTPGDAETTQWSAVSSEPGPSAFGWPPSDPSPAATHPLMGHSGVTPPYIAPPAGPLVAPPSAVRSRSARPTPAMPEMAAPPPVPTPFHGPSGIYMPTSGPRPAISAPTPIDPLAHDAGLAALLSTFLPGMGQVYNGQRDRGIVFALTALFIVPWLVGVADAWHQATSILFMVPWLVGVVDAWHQATSIRRGEQPVPDPQIWRTARWAQLVLDIAVFTAILVAVDLWVGPKGGHQPPPPSVSVPLEP